MLDVMWLDIVQKSALCVAAPPLWVYLVLLGLQSVNNHVIAHVASRRSDPTIYNAGL